MFNISSRWQFLFFSRCTVCALSDMIIFCLIFDHPFIIGYSVDVCSIFAKSKKFKIKKYLHLLLTALMVIDLLWFSFTSAIVLKVSMTMKLQMGICIRLLLVNQINSIKIRLQNRKTYFLKLFRSRKKILFKLTFSEVKNKN